ncbi:MAG: hypothetical protein PHW11_01120 [Anaerolineaceae bacterium]|jgi:hypothetical protein|nr:hypothetical protein [Anaerolineaceae bacterium]MDD4043184.1 hypothetical protein [Anaerolineaceae bacterium]MDD4578412.1 hypothetical protein [Anaerolineaceae bacterium]
MSDDFEGVVIVETYEEEFGEADKGSKKGCMTVMAILLAVILVLSAAVPLARFVIRKNYERQVEKFPGIACNNLLISDFYGSACDPTLNIVEFVANTFPIGVPKSHVNFAMVGFDRQELSGVSQVGCVQPELWTYSVARSFLGWKTEIEFFFCSETLIERRILVDGAPVALLTYDL